MSPLNDAGGAKRFPRWRKTAASLAVAVMILVAPLLAASDAVQGGPGAAAHADVPRPSDGLIEWLKLALGAVVVGVGSYVFGRRVQADALANRSAHRTDEAESELVAAHRGQVEALRETIAVLHERAKRAEAALREQGERAKAKIGRMDARLTLAFTELAKMNEICYSLSVEIARRDGLPPPPDPGPITKPLIVDDANGDETGATLTARITALYEGFLGKQGGRADAAAPNPGERRRT